MTAVTFYPLSLDGFSVEIYYTLSDIHGTFTILSFSNRVTSSLFLVSSTVFQFGDTSAHFSLIWYVIKEHSSWRYSQNQIIVWDMLLCLFFLRQYVLFPYATPIHPFFYKVPDRKHCSVRLHSCGVLCFDLISFYYKMYPVVFQKLIHAIDQAWWRIDFTWTALSSWLIWSIFFGSSVADC